MLSINAVKGFEYGSGFVELKNESEHNDLYNSDGTTKQIFQVVFKVELAME
jgi:chorismate synthase